VQSSGIGPDLYRKVSNSAEFSSVMEKSHK